MAEVHEICRTAFKELTSNCRFEDAGRGYGDYVIVHAWARFGKAPLTFYAVENFDTEYWACRRCDGMNNNSLLTGVMFGGVYGGRVGFSEVWHIVDDADDIAETLESLRQLREAGALSQDLILDNEDSIQGNTWEGTEDISIKPLHDAPYNHMGKGGKVQNWHLLIKFDGDDNEYRLTSADDARNFITTIESIYQLEQSSDADNDCWEDDLDELLMSGEGSNWRIKCPSVDKLEFEAN